MSVLMFKDTIKFDKNFITDNGYIIVDGDILHSENNKQILSIELSTQGYKIIASKGIEDIKAIP